MRKGIPEALRSLIWQLLCNVHNNRVQVREKYVQLLRQTSPCEKVIKRDIPRTFPEHQYFREKGSPGQEGLFNVMKAYSLFDAEVGYCQGSAFVVGQLLLNMPEEDAFTVFQALMYDYRLREMFKPTMAELGLCIYQLECIVQVSVCHCLHLLLLIFDFAPQEILPELFNHFQQQNFYTSMYASSWFLTLFSSNLPLHIANRVMDLFLFDGLEIIFRLSIAILQLCRDELLRLDMEGLLKYFQKEMPHKCDIDPDYLIHLAINVKLDQKKMKKLAKDYTTIKQKEQEEMVELRVSLGLFVFLFHNFSKFDPLQPPNQRLRTENRLLRQKIDVLELESGELADKLIQGQVCRAQEAEDNFVIKRELAAAKQSETEQLERITKLEADLEAMRQKQRLSQSLECQEHKELVESLQEELVAVKLRDAENNEEMKCLRERIRQLEEEVAKLRELPADHATARLQDELLASKLREGEALMSIKELKEKIGELQVMWQEHMTAMHPEANAADPSQPSSLENGSKENSLNNNNNNSLNSNSLSNGPTSSSTSTSLSVTSSPMKILNAVKRNFDQPGEINRLKTELMGTKLKEAEAVSDLKETRQRILELETQNTVTMNQIRRQAEEMKRLEEQLEALGERERQANMRLHQEQSRYSDLDFLVKEENMMKRIKELEQTQLVAELRQKISSLETKVSTSIDVRKQTN